MHKYLFYTKIKEIGDKYALEKRKKRRTVNCSPLIHYYIIDFY